MSKTHLKVTVIDGAGNKASEDEEMIVEHYIDDVRDGLFDAQAIIEIAEAATCSENTVEPNSLERALNTARLMIGTALERLDSVAIRQLREEARATAKGEL